MEGNRQIPLADGLDLDVKETEVKDHKVLGQRNWEVNVWKTAGGGLVLDISLRCLSYIQRRYGMGSWIHEFGVREEGLKKLKLECTIQVSIS